MPRKVVYRTRDLPDPHERPGAWKREIVDDLYNEWNKGYRQYKDDPEAYWRDHPRAKVPPQRISKQRIRDLIDEALESGTEYEDIEAY